MHQHSVINSSLNQHSNTKYPCISAADTGAGFKALKYHWREVPQVPFLSGEMCFWQQKYFVMTNIILSQQTFCHDKRTFVVTKRHFLSCQICVCHDKIDTLLWQKWYLRQLPPMTPIHYPVWQFIWGEWVSDDVKSTCTDCYVMQVNR